MKSAPKKGDRVVYRGKAGTVVDDYWKDRDRYSVLFDGSSEPLDFGAEALMIVAPNTDRNPHQEDTTHDTD